ncbi:MAG: hypothetical protein KGZ96_14710 [Clostridia bacterium]|nr:hypothetical protein [Clostridia bacterium]
MSDRITAGAVSGIIAGIIMGLISMILFAANICKLCIIAIGGGIFTGHLMNNFTLEGYILSWLIHLALSGAFGVMIAIMLTYLGTKHHILKGAGLLTLVFIADIGFLAPLRGIFPDNQAYFDLLLLLLYHIFFGSLASYIFVKYHSKKLV